MIVFCSRKQNVKTLAAVLHRAKFAVEEIHSDLEQDKREQALLNFKNGKSNILVATDILSRGIDIEDIDLVINYDVPNDGEDYIHRIGRTARAATDGTAYTFISPKEQGRFARIEELLGNPVVKATVPRNWAPFPNMPLNPANPAVEVAGTAEAAEAVIAAAEAKESPVTAAEAATTNAETTSPHNRKSHKIKSYGFFLIVLFENPTGTSASRCGWPPGHQNNRSCRP